MSSMADECPGDFRPDDGEERTEAGIGAVGQPHGAAALAVEVAELRAELSRVEEQAAERLAAWKRARADYENLKRRSATEVNDRAAHATSALLMELLPIVDDFERAFHADRSDDQEAWAEGIALIERELMQLLERLGVQPIAAEGQPFDPNFHDAVSQGPGPAGEVIAQVRKGYLLGPRVLRPSMVVVGQGDDAAASDD
jgi:molecular chaperone GrpE